MRVLVADKFEKSGIEGLQALGCEVISEPELQGDALASRVKETVAEVLVVRGTKVEAAAVEGSKISLIIRAGAGYNTIDVDAASRLGILVTNCPGKNSIAVAELAFGLMFAIDRRIPDNVSELRAGKWNKKAFSKGKGLYGRTLGLVGLGNIGQEMIPRAKAFGMNVVAHSRWMTPDLAAALGIARAASIDEVATHSDVISVHVALTKETRGMIGEKFFKEIREGAIFLNTSRAEVVDQNALLKAIETKGVFAGLDVFDEEPTGGEGTYDGPLKDNAGVYCTHHIGASTEQAQEAIAAEVVRIVREMRATGMPPNVVNVRKAESATHVLVVRHLDRVGVLSNVLKVLTGEGVNVQEMENIVLGGAKSAIAQISVDKEPTSVAMLALKRDQNVLDASVFAIEK